MDLQKIGACLRELRKEKGLTQEQLAAQFNVSVKTVSRWENGVHMPDIELLLELADFYEVDLRALLRGERVSEKTAPETKVTLQETAAYNKAKSSIRKRIAVEISFIRYKIKWGWYSLRLKIQYATPKMILKNILLGILILFGAVILFRVIRLITLPRLDPSYVYHDHAYGSLYGQYETTRDHLHAPKKKAVARFYDAFVYTLKNDPDEFYLSPRTFVPHLPYSVLVRRDMMQPPAKENVDHIDICKSTGEETAWHTLRLSAQNAILEAYGKSTIDPEEYKQKDTYSIIETWQAKEDCELFPIRIWFQKPSDLYYRLTVVKCDSEYGLLLEDGETLIPFDGSLLQMSP